MICFDEFGHFIDDPLLIINCELDFVSLGMKPLHDGDSFVEKVYGNYSD